MNMLKMNKKGFSMGESVLAIFVISVGITAMIAFVANAIRETGESRNVIVAAGLAQEGAELMRNLKDSNLLENQPYNQDMTTSPACVDVETRTWEDPNNLACGGVFNLNLDANGFYVRGAGIEATKFSRKILYVAGPPVKVISLVWWGTFVPTAANYGTGCLQGSKCTFVEVEFYDLVLGL